MSKKVDLSPETICGTVIDTQEVLIAGREPNDAQIRACQLANASEGLLSLLTQLVHSHEKGSPGDVVRATKKAIDLLRILPPPIHR